MSLRDQCVDFLNRFRTEIFLSRRSEELEFIDSILFKQHLKRLVEDLPQKVTYFPALRRTCFDISQLFPDKHRGLFYELIVGLMDVLLSHRTYTTPQQESRCLNVLMLLSLHQGLDVSL